jgi:hypothetical protein
MKHAPMLPVSLAAVLMLAAFPALADSEARAYIGPVSYTLRDLDPTDGWSPSLTFTDTTDDKGGAFASASREFSNDIDSRTNASPWAPVDASVLTPVSSAESSLSGGTNGAFIGASLLAQGHAVSAPPSPLPSMNTYFAGVSTGNWAVTLSPHTEVTFHGTGGVFATLSPALPSRPGDGFGPMDHAYAHAQFWAEYSLDGQVLAAADIFMARMDDLRDGNSLLSASEERRFSLPLANLGADSLAIRLSAAAQVFGGAVSPVPEPAPLALWASGLGLMAWAFRRRGRLA